MAAGGNRACRILLARLSRVAGHLYRCISGNVTTAGNVATAFAIATGNTLEALVGAWLVNRFAGGTNVLIVHKACSNLRSRQGSAPSFALLLA